MTSSVQVSIALLEGINAGLRERLEQLAAKTPGRKLRLDRQHGPNLWRHVPRRLWRLAGATVMVSLLVTAGGVLATFR